MTPQELAAAVADVVQDHMQLVMAPVLADVKSLQTQIAGWESRWNDLGTLRERVAVVEATKQPPVPAPVETVDLTPVLERLASTEALLKVQGDLRDRVLVFETKAAAAVPTDPVVQDMRDRVLALESKTPPVFEVPADVLSRLSVLEARPLLPPAAPVTIEKTVDLGPIERRLSLAELMLKAVEPTSPLMTQVTDLAKDMSAMRERLAVVEVRPAVPGPPGEPGPPGTNGVDGKDGLAGLSFEGVYQEGHTYEKGQLATWGGSSWHCNATTTTKPGDGSKDWTLMVKRGRDGKDGLHAPGALPVVAVGGRA